MRLPSSRSTASTAMAMRCSSCEPNWAHGYSREGVVMLPVKIRHFEVRNHVLNPAEAELWVTVTPTDLVPDGELRGRLVGPRCHYATTVEVAYALRPVSD